MNEAKIAEKISLEAQDKAVLRQFQQSLFRTFNKMKKRLDDLQRDMVNEAKKLSDKMTEKDVDRVMEKLNEMIDAESQEFGVQSWDYLSDDVMILKNVL